MVTRHWGEHEVAQEARLRERARRYGLSLVAATEILKEVRVRGTAVRLTYRLPMTVGTPPSKAREPRTEEFFTLHQMVEPMGVEPTTSRVRSCHTFPGLPIPGRNIQRF
jgi:hypothetical protein